MHYLNEQVGVIKGIGKKTIEHLNENNIITIKDLVNTFPKTYKVYDVVELDDFLEDTKLSAMGLVTSVVIPKRIKQSLNVLIFSMLISGKNIKVIIFGQEFLRFKIQKGMNIVVSGTYKPKQNELVVTDVFFEHFSCRIENNYGLKNISTSQMQRFVDKALRLIGINEIIEEIPNTLREKYRLLAKKEYLVKSHFPQGKDDLKQVMRRRKYSEMFIYALKLENLKKLRRGFEKASKKVDFNLIKEFCSSLPYELTLDQKKAVNDVLNDFSSVVRMNRLIQGDVGSGKSIIAIIAALANYSAGYQSVIMAPTEILAHQHYDLFNKLLSKYGLLCEKLTRTTNKSDRKDIVERCGNGRTSVLIGTQAILEDNVVFKKLGLAIIDEQHRFGVNERMKLIAKCPKSDALFLTATPIPRTLGLTSFGDLDITSINTLPNGRKKIITEIIKKDELELLFSKIEIQLSKNLQAYFVVPLVSESEKIDAFDVTTTYDLIKSRFPDYPIAILHGKLKAIEKNEIMANFKANTIKILVSTTVIEVGVDIKNATVMTVFNAERFGLSQIHQLRGRVGRNDMQAYCYLVSSNEDCARLDILCRCSDGFSLSNEDFLLRGPGDFFGERQSGYEELNYSDFNRDFKIWELALKDANDIFIRYTSSGEFNEIICQLSVDANGQSNKLN